MGHSSTLCLLGTIRRTLTVVETPARICPYPLPLPTTPLFATTPAPLVDRKSIQIDTLLTLELSATRDIGLDSGRLSPVGICLAGADVSDLSERVKGTTRGADVNDCSTVFRLTVSLVETINVYPTKKTIVDDPHTIATRHS